MLNCGFLILQSGPVGVWGLVLGIYLELEIWILEFSQEVLPVDTETCPASLSPRLKSGRSDERRDRFECDREGSESS